MRQRSLLKQGLFSTLCWGAMTSPLWSCPLPTEAVQRVFENTPALEQRSQLPGRCDYSWARAEQAQIAEQNAERLKQGAGSNPTQAPLWHRLQLEVYAQLESVSQAKSQFQTLLNEGPPQRYGSPDPLQKLQFTQIRPYTAWDKQQSALLFVKDNAIYRLHLQVPGLTPEKTLEKALALSEAVSSPKAP